jgi:hypothetical protein
MKLITVLLLSMCSAAQVHFSVQEVARTDKGISYRVINDYNQLLTAFTIAVDVVYADGYPNHSETSVDFLSAPGIAPGAAFEHIGGPPATSHDHGLLREVTLTPLVAIYKDGTSEALNKAAFHRIADVRTGILKALEVSVSSIQQALSTNSQHPAADASSAITQAMQQDRAATAGPNGVRRVVANGRPNQADEGWLKDTLQELSKAQSSTNERDYLEKYLETLRQKLADFGSDQRKLR